MAMTPDEISKLTIADLEQIAGRFADAVHLIRDARALLMPTVAAPNANSFAGPNIRSEAPAPPGIALSPAERATRERLLATQFSRGQVPDAMAAAMEGDS